MHNFFSHYFFLKLIYCLHEILDSTLIIINNNINCLSATSTFLKYFTLKEVPLKRYTFALLLFFRFHRVQTIFSSSYVNATPIFSSRPVPLIDFHWFTLQHCDFFWLLHVSLTCARLSQSRDAAKIKCANFTAWLHQYLGAWNRLPSLQSSILEINR